MESLKRNIVEDDVRMTNKLAAATGLVSDQRNFIEKNSESLKILGRQSRTNNRISSREKKVSINDELMVVDQNDRTYTSNKRVSFEDLDRGNFTLTVKKVPENAK